MKYPLIRNLVVLVVGSVLVTIGIANANPPTPQDPSTVTTLQRLHDQLATGRAAGDVPALQQAVDELGPVLAPLSDGDEQAAEAQRLNDQLDAALVGATPDSLQRQSLADLLNALIKALQDLINKLIGGPSSSTTSTSTSGSTTSTTSTS